MARRLVTRGQDHGAGRGHLFLGEHRSLLLCGDDPAQEIVFGGLPTLCDQSAEVVVERDHAAVAPLDDLVIRQAGAEQREDIVRPASEVIEVLPRHAQHRSDDDGRQRDREVPDDVHLARADDGVQHLVGDALGRGLKRLDDLRGERFAEQSPQDGVSRGIMKQHPVVQEADAEVELLLHGLRRAHPELVHSLGGETLITDHALDGKPLARRAEAEPAPRVALAALAFAGIVHQRAQGYDLRSRCLLIPDGPLVLEAIAGDGGSEQLSLTVEQADALVAAAHEAVKAAGLGWQREPIRLKPPPKLVALRQEERRLVDTLDRR